MSDRTDDRAVHLDKGDGDTPHLRRAPRVAVLVAQPLEDPPPV